MSEKREPHFDMNLQYCKSCGICYSLCPKNVLAANENGKPKVVDKDACIVCKLCELRCPDFVIRVEG